MVQNTAACWMERIFRMSLWEQARFRQIERLHGTGPQEMKGLVIGGSPAMQSVIHDWRGQWCSVAFSAEEKQVIDLFAKRCVAAEKGARLPFDDGEFDRIVAVDMLGFGSAAEDYAFIQECHRLLKESGILILNVAHRKRWGFFPWVQRLLGLNMSEDGVPARGYTDSELFDVLKDGYDVQETHNHSRFFLETAHAMSMFMGGFLFRVEKPPADHEVALAAYYHRVYKFLRVMRPFEWLFSRLDVLLFAAKGYQLTARNKKRMWRPRKTPVLRDGRSIAEAALGGKIGTALEY